MQKIMVIGCCGAGKSTLAKKLGQLTKLPVFHLDQYYWKANWVESSKSEWEPKVQKLAAQHAWIIDGNYGSTMDIRLEKADTIIYLDYPTWKCLWRITKRTLKYWRRERPDMPQGCKERFDLEFFHYVAVFNIVRRKSLLKKIDKYKADKKIHILKSDLAQETFLNQIKNTL